MQGSAGPVQNFEDMDEQKKATHEGRDLQTSEVVTIMGLFGRAVSMAYFRDDRQNKRSDHLGEATFFVTKRASRYIQR